jgi:signal transduction histidine kinase
VLSWFSRLNLIKQFCVAALVVIGAGMAMMGFWINAQIKEGVIRNTADNTRLYLQGFVEPLVQEFEADGTLSADSRSDLMHLLKVGALKNKLVGLKVWRPDGMVLFSNRLEAIGKTYPLEPALASALRGATSPEFESMGSAENEFDDFSAEAVIEIYAPLHDLETGKVIAAGEFYLQSVSLAADLRRASRLTWAAVGLLGASMAAALSFIMLRANTIIEHQRRSLETQVSQLSDLLEDNRELNQRIAGANSKAADLTDRFLGQIGADLHDGPAQLLGLALMQIEDPKSPRSGKSRRKYDAGDLRGALKTALKDIRQISSGLVLPELDYLNTNEAIELACSAHERFTGTLVERQIEDQLPDLPRAAKASAYRLVQEGLNNAFKHAGGAGQRLTARKDGSNIVIEVEDSGPGFEWTGTLLASGHMGLTGLQNRILALGGAFNASPRGEGGTKLSARIPTFTANTAQHEEASHWDRR